MIKDHQLVCDMKKAIAALHTKTELVQLVFIRSWGSNPFDKAQRVCQKLSSLGFENRGKKTQEDLGRRLGELNYTEMPTIIVEVCFVEATRDVEIYLKHGPHVIAKAIAEGITGQTVDTDIV